MSTAQTLNIQEFMARHLVEVFDTMLAIKAVPADHPKPPAVAERVTGSVAFAGDAVTGAVYLHLSAGFATRSAAAMLGLSPEEAAGESEVNDVVGEITNMLAGGLKSALCDSGVPCAVSTPAIIRGTSFAIESAPGVERVFLAFLCDPEHVVVEVHIKYT